MINKIASLREQTKLHNKSLNYKVNNVLPKIMSDQNIDTWVVTSREYNDDPVLKSLMPLPMITGDEGLVMPTTKRWMFFVFHLTAENEFKSLMVAGPWSMGVEPYKVVYPNQNENEWQCLNRVLQELKPKQLGLNISQEFSHTDGLKFTEYNMFKKYLHTDLFNKMVSAEQICLQWLEYRSPVELEVYKDIVSISHEIIAEAFSGAVVKPNVTTVEDISWYMRQKINDLGLIAWFMPMVSFIREGEEYRKYNGIVKKGDVLHCDMGLRYYGLLSDTQQLAYILKDEEIDVPLGLKQGMKLANDLQDIHMDCMVDGKTGNEILLDIRNEMNVRGMSGKVWTHPIGVHGHGAGPLIGTYMNQNGDLKRGDVSLKPNTCYAMELCIFYKVPEWNDQLVSFNIEETIGFIQAVNESKAVYFKNRQTSYHLI